MNNPFKILDKKILAIILGAALLITLISVIAIVLVVTKENRDTLEALKDRQRREEQALTSSTSFGIEDYYLDIRDPDVGAIYPARVPRTYWPLEEVNKYWIPPSKSGISTLKEDNDEKIFQSLGVPHPGGSK